MTPWIPGGTIPPCPCGAPTDDQVRRSGGGHTRFWSCLACQTARPADPGWDDPLAYVSQAGRQVLCRRMRARAQLRQPGIPTDHRHGEPRSDPPDVSSHDGTSR